MDKNPKSESYIIKEAENIIEEYIKNREDDEECYFKEKYERLRMLSIAMGVTYSLGILITIITQNFR